MQNTNTDTETLLTYLASAIKSQQRDLQSGFTDSARDWSEPVEKRLEKLAIHLLLNETPSDLPEIRMRQAERLPVLFRASGTF